MNAEQITIAQTLCRELRFEDEWAYCPVSETIDRLQLAGFFRTRIKQALIALITQHDDLVAPSRTAERMITYNRTKQQAARMYLHHRGWVTGLRIHRTLPDRLANTPPAPSAPVLPSDP